MLARFSSKMSILKGGEMMKTLVLVVALLCVVSGFAVADTTADLYVFEGWNRISVPIVPFDSTPEGVFGSQPINSKLFRIDAPNQNEIMYDILSPEEFGNILLGDGYQLLSTSDAVVSFSGVDDGVPSGGIPTDMWISLPGIQGLEGEEGGWHLIGQPFAHDTPVGVDGENIKFTNGEVTLNWKQAFLAGWVDSAMYTIDGGSELSCGYILADVDYVQAGHSYFILTKKANLAMIIDGQAGWTAPEVPAQ